MRRFLGGAAMVTMTVVVGAAAVGLWAGVGRADAPDPATPVAERVVVLPAVVTRPEPASTAAPVPAQVPAPVPAPTAPVDVPLGEPVAGMPTIVDGGRFVISCGVGPDGAFVEVPAVGDCAGGSALRIEATVDA